MWQQGLTAMIWVIERLIRSDSKFPEYIWALTYSIPSIILAQLMGSDAQLNAH